MYWSVYCVCQPVQPASQPATDDGFPKWLVNIRLEYVSLQITMWSRQLRTTCLQMSLDDGDDDVDDIEVGEWLAWFEEKAAQAALECEEQKAFRKAAWLQVPAWRQEEMEEDAMIHIDQKRNEAPEPGSASADGAAGQARSNLQQAEQPPAKKNRTDREKERKVRGASSTMAAAAQGTSSIMAPAHHDEGVSPIVAPAHHA